MVFWLILIIFLLLVLIILIFPLNIIIKYDKALFIKVGIANIYFKVVNPKNKNITVPATSTKSPTKEKKVKKDDDISKMILKLVKRLGIFGTIGLVKKLLRLVISATRKILKRTTIKELNLNLKVSGTDAADTAIKYAGISAGVCEILSIISVINAPERQDIVITPNFLSEKIEISGGVHVQARLFYIMYTLVFLFKEYKKANIKI